MTKSRKLDLTPEEILYNVERRSKRVINTDPQRRCYYGHHYSSETVWSEWEPIVLDIVGSRIDKVLDFWRDLNDYAVKERGESAYCEHRAVKV
jgi:hypothetical protein